MIFYSSSDDYLTNRFYEISKRSETVLCCRKNAEIVYLIKNREKCNNICYTSWIK